MGGLLSILLNGTGGNNTAFLWNIIACLISGTVVVFVTLPIHEYAHGFVATKLGDPTPRWQGRLSLNPLRHIDYFGAIMIYLIGFGYAKPVQVDARYFKNAKRDMAFVALAGPMSNILFAFVSAFLLNLVSFIAWVSKIQSVAAANIIWILLLVFQYMTVINISLAIFNLVPIPPLDGSKILGAFLPNRIYYQFLQYERYFIIFIMFLMFMGTGFSSGLTKINLFVYDKIVYLTGLPFELFL